MLCLDICNSKECGLICERNFLNRGCVMGLDGSDLEEFLRNSY